MSPPSDPATPFPFLIFQHGQVCGVGCLTIGLSGLAPAPVLPSTQAQTHFPPSQECSGSASHCLVSCTIHVSPLHRNGQGGCTLRQALMSSHSCWYPRIAPSASQHSTSRELPGAGLSDGGPCPAGFPAASTGVLQGIQTAFYCLITLNFHWRKRQSRWCLGWEQLTFDVFRKHSLAKGH